MNGKNSPFRPFQPPNGNIPLVGQAFTVKGGFPTVMLMCTCGGHEPILLIANGPGFCPACRRGFVVTKFSFDAQTGQIQTTIGLVRTDLQPAPVQAPEPAAVS